MSPQTRRWRRIWIKMIEHWNTLQLWKGFVLSTSRDLTFDSSHRSRSAQLHDQRGNKEAHAWYLVFVQSSILVLLIDRLIQSLNRRRAATVFFNSLKQMSIWLACVFCITQRSYKIVDHTLLIVTVNVALSFLLTCSNNHKLLIIVLYHKYARRFVFILLITAQRIASPILLRCCNNKIVDDQCLISSPYLVFFLCQPTFHLNFSW